MTDAILEQAGLKWDAGDLRAAAELYKRAYDLGVRDERRLNIMAVCWMHVADESDGDERESWYAAARAVFTEMESAKEGSASYNLACWHAKRGEALPAREWLERAVECALTPFRDDLANDPDLESVRAESWFTDLLVRVEPEPDET
ncbi:MAG: hypothetical protein O3A46_01480 [Candidatus Poribacteria bacterium]|nr:hypothetical protein [Candidatus Poribacteria bacterium]